MKLTPEAAASVARRRIDVLGLSLREVASAAQLSVGTVQRVERGEQVEPTSVAKYVRALGCPTSAMDRLRQGKPLDPDEPPPPAAPAMAPAARSGINIPRDLSPEALAKIQGYVDAIAEEQGER